MIKSIMEYNRSFVEVKLYEKYQTDKHPNKKIAIISCMDTRLTELLPAAMGLRNGDAKIIKNAGGIVSHPYGSVMRSLMVAVYEQGIETILVVGHDDCGMLNLDGQELINKMLARGVTQETIDEINAYSCDLKRWLSGFSCIEDSVVSNVRFIKNHPLIPKDINVYGLLMNSSTGELTQLI